MALMNKVFETKITLQVWVCLWVQVLQHVRAGRGCKEILQLCGSSGYKMNHTGRL